MTNLTNSVDIKSICELQLFGKLRRFHSIKLIEKHFGSSNFVGVSNEIEKSYYLDDEPT